MESAASSSPNIRSSTTGRIGALQSSSTNVALLCSRDSTARMPGSCLTKVRRPSAAASAPSRPARDAPRVLVVADQHESGRGLQCSPHLREWGLRHDVVAHAKLGEVLACVVDDVVARHHEFGRYVHRGDLRAECARQLHPPPDAHRTPGPG